MKKKQMTGLIVAAALFIVTGAASVLTDTIADKRAEEYKSILSDLNSSTAFDTPSENYIAVVCVEGTIQQQTETGPLDAASGYRHNDTMNFIDYLMQDSYNKGILLYVDSPGGTVYESDELYDKLEEYKETTGNPVWDYMAHYAASGGYMISMAADKIYANQNTTTGSIGVIMSGYDLSGLYEKLGIRYVSITSGENKDSSKLTDEQIDIYQMQINEYYEKFVGIVADGRDMTAEEVKALADGRTYTASQALNHGLIDEIDTYSNMQDAMSSELGTTRFYQMESSDNSILASLLSDVKESLPKSEAQVLRETAAELESGVPMYYAEQLQ